MIDIHTHILPGVDDGARNLEEALAMARIAVADGITHLFATPHTKSHPSLSRHGVLEQVARLQAELDAANIPLKLLSGHEVRLHNNFFDDWMEDMAGPLGNSCYVLAEPLFNHYDKHTDEMLFELFDRGYTPVMAHPERIGPIQDNLALLEPFLGRGGLTQITATSLTGQDTKLARKTAEEMLRNGMVHIIASDAHKPYHRPPALSSAREIAAGWVGSAQATLMVVDVPGAIVNNQPVAPETLANLSSVHVYHG